MTTGIAGSNPVNVIGLLSFSNPGSINGVGNLNALDDFFANADLADNKRGFTISPKGDDDSSSSREPNGNVSIKLNSIKFESESARQDSDVTQSVTTSTSGDGDLIVIEGNSISRDALQTALSESTTSDVRLEISVVTTPVDNSAIGSEITTTVTLTNADEHNASGIAETKITLTTTQVENAAPVTEIELTCETESGEIQTISISVTDLQCLADECCDPSETTSRQQLYSSLQTVFQFLGINSSVTGVDFAAVFLLGVQGLAVDETGSINPMNTEQGGVLTAWASTYIGSAIPPDIEAELMEAGASEDFIYGYNAVRQYLIDKAAEDTPELVAETETDTDVEAQSSVEAEEGYTPLSEDVSALVEEVGHDLEVTETIVGEVTSALTGQTQQEIVDINAYLLQNGSYWYLQDFNFIDYTAIKTGKFALNDIRTFKDVMAKKRDEEKQNSQEIWQAVSDNALERPPVVINDLR